MTKSEQLFDRAKMRMPGGVNSPVRAFQSVGMSPRFIERAKGSLLWDADGNCYVDYVSSWGPMILGHAHPVVEEAVCRAVKDGLSFGAVCEKEVQMAELICAMIPSVQMVRMVNSGTEAVMSVIRLARGFTGKDKIIKFAGCYHGHSDGLLVTSGSGLLTQGLPDSSGVPRSAARDTLVAEFNDLGSVKTLFANNPGEIAAVIVEPVCANMGVIPPEDGFLQGLRSLCDQQEALLIFDEVITGFRLAKDGAQGYFGVQPDLSAFGKIIGAGMPVGAYGGKKEIMQMVAPAGPVYQAGTLSGNPVAMAAGLAQLELLCNTEGFYETLNATADRFFAQLKEICKQTAVPCRVQHIGSIGCLFFTDGAVKNHTQAKSADIQRYARYFKYMLDHGVYLAPSQFEAMFLSAAHSAKDLEQMLALTKQFMNTTAG